MRCLLGLGLGLFLFGCDKDGSGDTGEVAEDRPTLTPEDAREEDLLTCAWGDMDLETEASVAWELNEEVLSGRSGVTMSGAWFNRRDVVACLVTPNTGGAPTYRSNRVAIINTAPLVLEAWLSPEEPTEHDLVYAYAETLDMDPEDQGRTELHYLWSVNGEESGVDDRVLGPSYWQKGDEISVAVWAGDGVDDGEALISDSVIVFNAPPSAPEMEILQIASGDSDRLQCAFVEVSEDLDGDTVEYAFQWWEFGILLVTESDILETVKAGGHYTCESTPSDGEELGDAGEATIQVGGAVLRYRWAHEVGGDQAGGYLLAMPDLDGDGLSEVAVSAASAASDAGKILVLSSDALEGDSDLGAEAVWLTLAMDDGGAHAGAALALVPDFDGDGLEELAVGAPDWSHGGNSEGLTVVVPSSSMDPEDADALDDANSVRPKIQGTFEGARLGQALAGADLDGDGLGDLLMGCLNLTGDELGGIQAVSGASMANGGNLFTDDHVGLWQGEGEGFGASIALVGDLSPGGEGSIVTAAPDYASEAGRVYFFAVAETTWHTPGSGDPLTPVRADQASLSLDGEVAGDKLGSALLAVEIAGEAALLIGAPGAQGEHGGVYLWRSGDATLADSTAVFGTDGEGIGMAMALIGDVDGDGIEDVALGAPMLDSADQDAGGAYVISMADWMAGTGDLSLPQDAWGFISGESWGDRSGSAVLGEDMNGDGEVDLLMGTPGMNNPEGGIDEGGVLIWLQ